MLFFLILFEVVQFIPTILVVVNQFPVALTDDRRRFPSLISIVGKWG